MRKQRRDHYQLPLFNGISIALQQPWPQNSLGYLEDIPSANSCSSVISLGGGGMWGGIFLAGNSDSSSRLTSALQDPCLLRQGKALPSSLWNWGFRQQSLTLDKNEENGVHIGNIMVSLGTGTQQKTFSWSHIENLKFCCILT
jgi:hypothetical protein